MYDIKKSPILEFANPKVYGKVSVIIPSFNRCTSLDLAIQSVLRQSYQNLQIIVVDDGSTDNTSDLLNSYEEEISTIYQLNQGVSKARNVGIEASSGEWIAFLDSDDTWLDNKIEKQINSLKSSHLLVNHTQEIWIRNGVRVNPKKKHFKYDGSEFNDNLDICRISPSSVVIHRSIFEALGGFDENLPACEDYDLWLRICNQYKVEYLDQKLVQKTGGHEDQLSRKYFGMDRFRIISLAKMLYYEKVTKQRQMRIYEEIDKKISIYKKGCLKRDKHDEIHFFNQLQKNCFQIISKNT